MALCALLAAACNSSDSGGPAGPPTVVSRFPSNGATNAETGTYVLAAFDRGMNAATITPSTFTLTLAGVPVPELVLYSDGTHTATAAAPFLPGHTYNASVTTGVVGADGQALATTYSWEFATRAWVAGTAGSSTSLDYSSLARTQAGSILIAFEDVTAGTPVVEGCATNCTDVGSWQGVGLESGTQAGAGVALALNAAGAVHVIYARQSSGALGYATCPTSCTSAANWTVGTADSVLGGHRGDAAALAVDGTQLHASYHDSVAGNLRYATCSGSCTDPTQWQSTIVNAGSNVGRLRTSILASGGALHIAYWDATNHALRYATCTATCTTSGSWTSVMVDQGTDLGEYASLTQDASGRLHVVYANVGAPALRYATCSSNCTVHASWTSGAVATGTLIDPSVFVDAAPRLHVTYYNAAAKTLVYATCVSACTTTASWQSTVVDGSANVGAHSSLVVDTDGRAHASYVDHTHQLIKYIE